MEMFQSYYNLYMLFLHNLKNPTKREYLSSYNQHSIEQITSITVCMNT